MIAVVVFFIGLLFGLGLIVSGMANPAKVIGFLDIAGNWDPSLAFVMGGALAVTIPGYYLLFSKAKPIAAAKFDIPTESSIDAPLLTGATLFGIGWGLVGLCPGPALTALGSGMPEAFIFIAAMLAGMMLKDRPWQNRSFVASKRETA